MNIYPFTIILSTIEAWAMHGGYTFLFLISILEAVPCIGTTIPGHITVIISGFLAKVGIFNIWIVLILSSSGAIIGDMIGFYIGRKYGLAIIERFKKHFFFKEEYIDKARALLQRHTGKALIIGRFNPLTRPFMPLLVGASRSHVGRFWFFNIVGGILWASSSVLVGYIFGAGYQSATGYFGKAVLIATVFALVSFWGYSFVNKQFHIFKKYELFSLILGLVAFFGLLKSTEDALSTHSFMASFDLWVNAFMLNNIGPFLAETARMVSFIGSTAVTGIAGLVAGIYLLWNRKWRSGTIMLIAMTMTGAITELMKASFMRLRPEDALVLIENDPSFPSGHSSMAAAFFVIVVYLVAPHIESLIKRELFVVTCVFAIVIIGLSRIMLNVHWASDVIAGWSLGIFCATGAILLVRYLGVLIRAKGR